MPSQDKLFLSASISSSNALTDVFDFVWPSAASLWNLQWQVKGFLAQMPTASTQDLQSRFVLGSGIVGVNLHRLSKVGAWPEIQQWFARLLLSETCALFEGWLEAALDELEIPSALRDSPKPRSLDKIFQFPSKLDASGAPSGGAGLAVSKIQGPNGSAFFQACILPALHGHLKHSFVTIDNLLNCYRAFKEVRNDFTHHGGFASQRAVDAFAAYAPQTEILLGLNEKPELPIVVKGEKIKLSLRGVVGLGDVVLRMIATFDYLMADSAYAEKLLKRRWKAKHGGMVTVKAAGGGRDAQLVKLIRQCGAGKPVNLTVLFAYLNGQGLVA